MQNYNRGDPYEREPLDSGSRQNYDSPPRGLAAHHNYPEHDAPYYDTTGHNQEASYGRGHDAQYAAEPSYNSYGQEPMHQDRPVPPPHGDNSYYAAQHDRGNQEMPESGLQAMRSAGQVPPPPSRAPNPNVPRHAHAPPAAGGYGYDYGYESSSSLAAPGPAAMRGDSRSPSRSPGSYASGDPYADDPYQGYTSTARAKNTNLGMVNPMEIEDDGDDGLHYPKHSQRNSMLSSSNSDRAARPGVGAAAAIGSGAAASSSSGGLLGKSGMREAAGYYEPPPTEKRSAWREGEAKKSKRWKVIVIIIVILVIIGAVVGGVVGGVVNNGRSGGKNGSGGSGDSAEEDEQKNGSLGSDSAEIKKLLNNPDLHKVFPGMDYTPMNTQYPDCIHDPPSQNNVTRDVAVLSQLTNKIRLYGTDCNQTEMVIHALETLKLEDEIKIWMGVWQDKNETTNKRQLDQMWDILDEYGGSPFEGIIVANEILFRKEMTIGNLSTILEDVREELSTKNIDLKVATSDLGNDWSQDLADSSDYIMSNIHPFFAGVDASIAASWTWTFWEERNGGFWKSNDSMNIISETGWPTSGGENCGQVVGCTKPSVAGVDELNTFMDDWVCEALNNGTQYFWFSAFDEPWKIAFNEDGKEWEDKWGLMDVNRNLKDGVKIPDCGGKTV